jgi:Outer membrane lipoprotein carrier protein LolA-like
MNAPIHTRRSVLTGLISAGILVAPGLGFAQSTPDSQAPTLLTRVLKEIAAKPVTKQRFVERKFIAQLDAPVDSTGELAYAPPAKLTRRAITPYAELTTIDADQVTIERNGRKQSIAIAQVPQLAALASTLTAVIKGDAAPLVRQFNIQSKGTLAQWSFVLLPRDAKAVGWLREIRISGQQGVLEIFELQLADGDRSVTRLLPL